jgi:long-chain acyl-CoA synthetase
MDGATVAGASNEVETRPGGGWAAAPGDIPRGTLVDLFFQAIDEFDKPDALQTREGDRWRAIAHREVLEQVRLITQALGATGTRRGDRVALLSENRPEWALADWAMICGGVLNVPVYPNLPPAQIAYLLEHAEVETAFVSTADQLAKMIEVRAHWPRLRRIVVFDDVPRSADGVETLADFMERGRAAGGSENEFRVEAKKAQPEDVATLVYTSGTTGAPKGVMLTHDNLYSNVLASLAEFPLGPADIALSFLPLSHVFQRLVDYVMFAWGATIAYVPSFDDVPRAFREVRPSFAVCVPRVYEKMYARILSATGLKRRLVLWARQVAIDWARADLGGPQPGGLLGLRHRIADRLVFSKIRESLGNRVRFLISGSAPLNPQIAEFFHGAGLTILEGYGLTETSPVTNVNTPSHHRIGTVGRPIAATEERIAEDGEILVRGRQIMKGYYRDEAATSAVIDQDGWFHTGDIGEIDADGYLRITDRKKELIKTAGGKYVAPQPLENAIKQSRYIAEAVLLGDRRPFPIVLVVPNFENLQAWAGQQGAGGSDPQALAADPRVIRFMEQEVERRVESFARHEKPKKVLVMSREFSIDEGEITPTLKVKRRVVEEKHRERIEALYSDSGEPT